MRQALLVLVVLATIFFASSGGRADGNGSGNIGEPNSDAYWHHKESLEKTEKEEKATRLLIIEFGSGLAFMIVIATIIIVKKIKR